MSSFLKGRYPCGAAFFLFIFGKNPNMPENQILTLKDGVSWIGALDRDIIAFDIVMETLFGTTYNSYFIDGGKKAVIDTVKKSFSGPYLEKIKKLTDPSLIE